MSNDNLGKKLGTGIASSIFTESKAGEKIGNLYTGKKLHPLIGIGVGVAGVAASVGRMNSASKDLESNDAAHFNQLGNLSLKERMRPTAPGASAQGVAPSILAGGQQTGAGNADNLGATGDMVFGMHNKRHG